MSNSFANASHSADKAGTLFGAASHVAHIFLPDVAAYFVIGCVLAGQVPDLCQDASCATRPAEGGRTPFLVDLDAHGSRSMLRS